MKPLLRWAGSKRQLLGHLRTYWDKHPGRYIEPFAGSAALFFDLEPKSAILGDTNSDLILFYQEMQENPEEVYSLAANWDQTEESYYKRRDEFKIESNRTKRSALFYFLNRFCFNGIYRTNLRNEFNVPFGKKTGSLQPWDEVSKKAALLNQAKFICGDFFKIVSNTIQAGDFIYIDPPYALENQRIFTQYNATTFGLLDLSRLSDLLYCIDAVGAKFVLSYAHSTEALHHFQSWKKKELSAQRNIAGFCDSRRTAGELLFTNI